MTAIHICFEGTEGCYKTTNAKALSDALREKGFSVLETKEPGTFHIPLTMTLRGIMLDSQYSNQMTRQARELISQAIRSIHIDNLIKPALERYDFIVQDRGMMSGIAYGIACGNYKYEIDNLLQYIHADSKDYDLIIYLQGDTAAGLQTAVTAKQEFEAGDAMESKGLTFMKEVESHFQALLRPKKNVAFVDVVNRSREEILQQILQAVSKIQKQ